MKQKHKKNPLAKMATKMLSKKERESGVPVFQSEAWFNRNKMRRKKG